MKRVGSIYSRDTSKSKDRISKLPLKDIDYNALKGDSRQQRQTKKWKYDLDNEQDSQQRKTRKQYQKTLQDYDRREITFSEPRCEQRLPLRQDDAVKKMACLSRIIAEINTLKSCGLKGTQQCKLMEIQDRLLEYERKLLHSQKQNYL